MKTEKQLINENVKRIRSLGRVMHTKETFPRYIEEITLGKYEVFGVYQKISAVMTFRHKECGREFERSSRNFIGTDTTTSRCPDCDARKRERRTIEVYKKEVEGLDPDYTVISSKYINDKTKMTHLHKVCGRMFEMIPNAFTAANHRCPLCAIALHSSNKIEKHKTAFVERVLTVDSGEYKAIGEYILSTKKVEILHIKCGKTWFIEPQRFFNKDRCPHCSLNGGVSKAMRFIESFLNERNISFEKEVTDRRCKNKHVLPFDYGFTLEDGRTLLLEYDGEQHFKPSFASTEEKRLYNLAITQFRDGIKTEFCRVFNKEFVLERISYTDDLEARLEEIVTKRYNIV